MTNAATTTANLYVILSTGQEIGDLGATAVLVTAIYGEGTDAEYIDTQAWMSDQVRTELDADGELPSDWEDRLAHLVGEAEAAFPDVQWTTVREDAGYGCKAIRKGVRR